MGERINYRLYPSTLGPADGAWSEVAAVVAVRLPAAAFPMSGVGFVAVASLEGLALARAQQK
jgi:hypothetical protein